MVKGGGGGGPESRFKENKTVLSQFTKNKDTMNITVHGELNISRFTENNFAKSRFTTTMEITIHEGKISHFTFHGKKRADHESRKYPLPPSKRGASRLLWKSRFTREKLAISHFTGKKGPISSHENTLYHPLKGVLIRKGSGGGAISRVYSAAFSLTYYNADLSPIHRVL